MNASGAFARDGFEIFPHDPRVERWAQAAFDATPDALNDPSVPQDQLRHGRTWFVGLEALDNDATGAVNAVPLQGPWHVPKLPLHRAQVSIVYPGYPKQDMGESDANHRYRITRKAAHVDGVLPIGADKRRFAKELHAYILAIPLHDCDAAPTVVWQGSHKIMQRALRDAIAGQDPRDVDVTDAYQAARREVFESCAMRPLKMHVGEAALIHRFALHGTEVWGHSAEAQRAIAFFRPEFNASQEWLVAP